MPLIFLKTSYHTYALPSLISQPSNVYAKLGFPRSVANKFFLLFYAVDFQDFNEDESESDEDNSERASESEIEDDNDASNEEDYTSSGEARTDGSEDEVDIQASAEALRKLLPEEFEKVMFFF